MKKTFYIVSFLIISHFSSYSQSSINDYKYIVIPSQYDFLNEKDQYQLNSLTKFLFNKYGYSAYMQNDELPNDLSANRCLGLTADVIKESGFLKTKLRIDLIDCNGAVIQSSQIGETREKEFSKAYNFALRDAFTTFQNQAYAYTPNEKISGKGKQAISSVSAIEQEEITRLKEEIKTLKKENVEVVAVEKPKEQPKLAEIAKTTGKENDEQVSISTDLLYAQPIENGFQIVDTTPKKVMILRYSGVQDVFTVEGKKAIVYKKGNDWMYSETGEILKGELINIKF